jgi:Mg-chelatase subunit ChlD
MSIQHLPLAEASDYSLKHTDSTSWQDDFQLITLDDDAFEGCNRPNIWTQVRPRGIIGARNRLPLMMWNRTTTKSIWGALILVLISTAVVRAQAPASNAKTQTIKVDVDLVLVNVTVSDPLGRMVTGLEQEHFQVWEDKVEQKIEYFSSEDIPLSIGLIFDATGSMSDKISTARDAAVTFLKMGNPEDEFFLVTFSQRAQLQEDFTSDISRLQNRLLFTPAKGLTPLFDAVYLGLDKMKSATNKRRALLLITDGEDNHSRYSFADIKEFAKERDVQILQLEL